jgi:predicted DNA-binding transcriptional regulator YafY
MKISESKRQERMERIVLLLQRQPNGLKEQEIADILHLERRTVNNYLRELEAQGKIVKDDERLWIISPFRSPVLRKLTLEPEQAALLYLAVRLFVKQSDKRIETAETMLQKLTAILSEDMGLDEPILEAARELSERPQLPGYEDTFRTILRAYIYKRQVEILYRPYQGEPFVTVLSPYLIEPSGIGFANYVIGHSSVVSAIRTHKIERIERARLLLHQEFSVPNDFRSLDILRNAFSIYYGEDVISVVLRFHPSVARRVLETNWRTSLEPVWDDNNPGYLLVTFQVADTTDLKPWIRTWGANCEVLEPAELREEMIGETRQLMRLYDLQSTAPDKHSKFSDIFGV